MNPQKMVGGNDGLGDISASQGIQIGGSVAAPIASILAASAFGGPVGMVAGGVVAGLTTLFSGLFTPDYTKIYASNDANEISAELDKWLNGWLNIPVEKKSVGVQAYFVQEYNQLWQQLVQLCTNAQLGTAGQSCIADRSPGGKYDWSQIYLARVQNDPAVHVIADGSSYTFADPLSGVDVTIQNQTGEQSLVQGAEGLAIANPLLAIGAGLLILLAL